MAYALRSPLDPTYDPSQDRPDPGPLVMRNYGMGSTEPTPTAMTNYGMGSDRVSPLIPQSTPKAPVIAPVPQTEDQIVAAGGVPPSWEEKYLQPEPPPEKGFVGKLGQALGGGVDTLMGNLKATGNLYMGDYAGVEANANKAQEQAANRPKEQQAFGQAMAALPDNPGLIEGIKGMAGAIWEQPQGALQEFVAQAPNSAAVMGGMAAGGALGSAILPGIGTAVGAILGGFLGNLGIETGARLMDSGADGLTDAEAKQAMSEGALKAAGVTGVDMATLGATRWLMGAPSRAASKAIMGSLTKSGVDVADDAAVSAAMQTMGVGSEALLQGARAMARSTGRAPLRTLASAALETVGEGTGEYLGEVMATGQGNMKEALLESIMAAPMSAGEIVWAKSDANQPFNLGTALERATGTDLSDPKAVDNYINTNLPHFAALSLDQDQLGIISKDEAMQALGNPNASPLQRINAVAGIAADIATRQNLPAVSEAWLERAKALMANGEVIKVPGYTQPIPAYQEQQKADRKQEKPITPPPVTTTTPKAEASVAAGLAPKPIIPNRMEEQQTTGMIPRKSPLEVSAPIGDSAIVTPEKQEVTAPIVATAPVPDATPERPPFVPTHTASDGVPVRQIDGNEYEDANGDTIVDDYADKLTPQEAQGMRRASTADIAKQLQEEQDSINARQQFAKTNDGIPFTAPMRNQPQKTVMVTPSAQQPGKWQITYLDKNGEPSGDSQVNSYSEAVDVAHQYGANWDQVALSGQPSETVAAQEAPPVATSSIEKPSSGMQQKLAQNREEAKQSPTTPALNRNEGESYRDWAARSWVALQTKPTDGSWDSSVIENTANRVIKPLAQKLDKGGWSTLDNLTPTNRGSRDPRRSISRHLEEMKQQGLVQIAWDNQGNSHWSKSGTSLPNWLTTSTDEQAIASLSPKPANAIQSRLQENRAQQEAQAAPAPWEMTKDEYVATTTPKDPRDASFTKAINRKDVEARGDGIYYVPAKVATPQFLNRLKTQQERASLTGRVTPTNQFEFKPWSEVTGDTTSAEASGYAILDRRARQNERIGNDHRAAVQQALAEGKSIPTSVLKDYPDLTVSQETANEPQAVETQPLAINPKKQTPIFTPDGKRFSAQWDVVEADSLSPTLTTGENQPRDRNRIGSDLQIQTIANNPDFKRLSDIGQTMDVGAPTMTREGVIVGGNGRVAGVTRSYNIGKAQGYRQALIDRADEFGADPAQIAGMSKPVLVRRLQEPVDTRAMALASNKPQGLAMGSTETAKVDAERMRNLGQIEVTDTGDIATNADNIAKLRDSLSDYDITEQAGFIDGTGNISADGLRRVRNAVLHKAYGDSPVITRLLETADPDLKNVGTALVRAGGKMAEMNDVINRGDAPSDYAIATDVSQAIETLSQLRQNKVPLAEHLSQQNLFGEEHSPAEKRILQFLDENGRSAKAITSFLEDYADRVISSQGIGQDLFGITITPPTKDQVLTDVARSNTRTAPIPSGDLFTPTPAQQVASQPQDAGNNAPGNRVLGGETASGGVTEATTTAAVAPANTQAAPIPQAATETSIAPPLDIKQAEKQLAMAKARVSSLTNRINRLGPNATNRAALEQRLSVAQSEADAAQAKTDAIRLPDQTAIPEAPAVSTKPPAVSDLQYVKLNARDPVTKRIRDEDRGHMAVRYETPDGVINVGEIIDHRAAYGDTTTSQPWETSDGQRHMNLALAKKHELVTQVIPKLHRDGYLAPEAPPAAATARAPAPAVTNTPEVAPVNAAPSTEQQPTPAIAKTKVRTAYDLTDEEYKEVVADARYLKDVAYSIGNLLGNDKKAILRIGLSKNTRDTILMDALNIDRDLAHTINNGLDDKEIRNLRKQDMEEALVKFPMLKKLVDEHAPKPAATDKQAEAVTQGDDDDAAEAARRAVGLAAAGEYANSTIAEIMDGRASATIGDVALDGDTFGIVLKPNNTAGRLEIHLKPKTRPSFSVAWASNTQPFGKAMEALASNLTEGVQISLRENALGRAVAGKPDQEVAAEQAARQLFPVETAEQRQSLINRIIMTTPNELRGAVVRPNLEFEGRDGKWYGANGTPFNFQKTGKQRTAGYHLVNADGVGFGKRYATVAEAEDALRQQLQQRQDDLLKTLNGKSPEELFAAAKDALRADVQQQVARNEAQRQSEAKSAKAIAPNQQAAAVTEAELEDLQLFRKWGDRWQYKYMMGGNWMTANTQQDAMDRATKTYHKTPASERLTSQQRFDKANQDERTEMQDRYGRLSLAELQKQHAAMGGTIAELQEEGKREFNGNGGRRSGAAMAAQGARDTAEERSKLGRYIAWRQEQEQSKASLPDREIDSILPSDKPDSQSLLNDVLDEEFGATPVAKPRATRKPRAAKAPPVTKPTVAEAAGSAVKNFSEASTQALKGIAALFDPGKGTLGSGPVFNEDTWAKAKPLFVQAVQGYQASWQDIKEVIRAIVRALRELGLKREGVEAMSPYITRFADEVRDGVIILGGDNVQSTDTDAQGDSGATGDGGPSNQVHAEDGTGAAATASGRNGEQAGAEGIRPVGHRGLSGTGTAVEGEPGSDGLSRPDGELGDSQRTSRPGERDGGSRSSDTGVASGRQRAAAATGVTDAARALAEKTAITPAELDNIRTTLPQLLPSQQEDVQRAEQRFHTQNQLGMLFTNGTGTGKTFVGLGIVKRMARQGKTNIIITAPGEKIIDDWINAAKKFGLEIRKLADTKDAGQDGEIVITTYANFGQNDALVKRNWDLVVHDEAHYLMQDKDGTSTASLRKSRALTGHPDGALTYTEAMERDLVQQIADLKKASSFALTRERERLIEVLREREKAHAANRAELWKRKGTRRLDLSATPFAYETSIKAYEGFLFDFDRSQDNQGGYNKPNAFGDFMVRHFGWRMRTGKLTSPEASVDSGVMQRQFNRWLKQTGALSSRRLSVEQDYSREFIAVESLVGRQIDEGYDYIRERAYDRDNPLAEGYGMMLENLEERFPYHERIRLLEAIKAPFAVERARQHLALGRKVVIFHSRIQGGSVHPFKFSSGVEGGVYDRAIRDFKEQHPELVNLDLGGLTRPLDLLKNEFGDRVTFYNGTVSSKDKRNNPTKFNYDDGGVDVIVVQDDAGKEGISLHDTTGNKQRVLINIGLPIKPIQAIQIEGRIFRVGQASDAIFEYFNTGTTFERFTFATKISERASVAENMAMGDEARRLRDSFVDAFENPNDNPPSLEQGKGGKAADTAMESAVTPFQEAKTHYFANLKNTKRRDQREGIDYFATPEPLGLKMVEWSGMRPNDAVLEPSAGHGAIARYFPESVRATFVELSSELMSRLALRTNGKLRQQRFEDMDEAANKFDAIVMNPPYGTGGATARDHLAKAMNHLNNGGRIVALIPEGPAADAKFGALLYGSDNESVAAMKESLKKAAGENATRLRQRIHQLTNFHVRASISLPPVVFERAGTAVKTRVLIIDRLDKGGSRLGDSTREIDATNIKDFFDRIEEMSVYDRPPSPMEASEVLANNGITVSEQDTGFYVMGTKYEQAELLRPIMRKHQGQWNKLSKYWFTTTDPSEDLAKALQGETVEGLVTEQPAPVTDNPDIISHTTQAGKVIRGVVRTDMNADQAKAIDPYTFRKNGGWFIREAHLSKLPAVGNTAVFENLAGYDIPTGIAENMFGGKVANAGLPSTITIDGIERPTINSEGKPIHPTEEGVRNFWKWFGDSKVVDGQGRPLVVYHGTFGDFSIFDPTGKSDNPPDIGVGHFGSRYQAESRLSTLALKRGRKRTGQYASMVYDTDGANIMSSYLKLENPLMMHDAGQWTGGSIVTSFEIEKLDFISKQDIENLWKIIDDLEDQQEKTDAVKKYLKEVKGFDGIVYGNVVEGNGLSYLPFEKTQVKSSIGNRGTFDGSNPDIRFSLSPRQNTTLEGAWNKLNLAPVRQAIARIMKPWANAPQFEVFTGLDEMPKAVREAYQRQLNIQRQDNPNAQGDRVDAFWYQGKVWINSEAVPDAATLATTLRHETLGHHGLRALFGRELVPILDRVLASQANLVAAKAKAYGLDMHKRMDALSAAEEVLAEWAQTRPTMGVIRQLVAMIRAQLRKWGVLNADSMTRDEILREYVIPARGWVERGDAKAGGLADALVPAFMKQEQYLAPGEKLWLRYGEPPESGKSKHVQHGFDEDGVSVMIPLEDLGNSSWSEQMIFSMTAGEMGKRDLYVVAGKQKEHNPWVFGGNGFGSDGEPLITDARVIRKATPQERYQLVNDMEKVATKVYGFDEVPGIYEALNSVKPDEDTPDFMKQSQTQTITVDGVERPTTDSTDIRFSLSPRQNTTLDSAWQKLNLAPERQKTLTEHVQTLLGKNWRQAMTDFKANAYEGLFDGLINIDRAEKEVGITKPEQSGYVSARMATGIADTLWGVLNKGAPEWRNGVLAYKRGTKGLLTVLGDLGPDMRNWLGWMAGNRANELMAQGRENNLEQAEIDELLALATPAKAPKFLEAKAAYNALNSAMLDVAEQAGLIDPQSRSQWESEWYVPFYRQLEIDGDATLLGPRTTRGLSHQTSGIRALKGGSAPTADLLTNILTNWTKLVDASMKNHALSQVADNLNGTRFMVDETTKWKQVLVSKPEMIKRLKESPELVREMADWLGLPNGDIVYTLNEIKKMTRGEMEKLWTKVAPTDKEVIRIKRDGKNYYYRVLDPSLLRSIESFGFQGFSDPMTRTARTFKRLLTTGVTSMPDFIIRNFVRDAVHAWAINKDGMKFASDAVKGIRKTYGESDAYWDLVFSGGAFQGGYVHGTDPEASAQIVRRSLGRKGLSPTQIEARERGVLATKDRIIDVLDKYWERYRSWGDKAENINRLATYEAAIAAGKSPLQAAYEAKDLMDYSLRGNYQLLMRFTDMVPFLNARIQGLGKLGRAGMADPRIIGMKLAKIAAFSVALAMLNGDDDRYKKLEDWEKDAYWHFWLGDQQFRIPKPFEIGVLAGTIPERMWNTFVTGNQENDKMWWSVKHNILGTFSFNPIPQVALPVIENVANRSFFFDRPIENMSDLGQLPFNRFESRTSDTMRVLGSWLGASPKQLEHLTQGYLGTLGSYVMFLSDAVVRWAEGAPSKPDWTAGDIPVLKSFFRGSGPARNTVYATDLFDAFKEVEMIHRTITDMRKEGRMEDAQALQARSTDKLRFRPQILSAKKRLDEIRRQIDIISGSSLSSTMKRQRIDRLTIEKNRLSERVANQIAPAF